ncbi:MAG: protein kinase domain-containing protein, partial [Planctomycetales bacterium]
LLSSGWGVESRAVVRVRREAEAAARLHHTNIVPIYATGDEGGVYYYAMELIEGPSLDRIIRALRTAPPLDFETAERTGRPGRSASAGDEPIPPLPEWVLPAILFSGVVDKTRVAAGAPIGSAGSMTSSTSHLAVRRYFDNVARMIAEVADALAHAHSHGVIHRDIKPSNLLFSADGRLSINDFGLARVVEHPGMTMTGEFVGSPAYMSPEQITGGEVPVDQRTDIYSLGATLYELLALRPPFVGDRRDQVLSQILQRDPVPPSRFHRRIPADLETICLKALEKDPARRYQTAAELARDLRNFLNRFAILARRTGPIEKAVKWIRRHQAVTALFTCAALAVILATVFGWNARTSRQELHETQLQDALDDGLISALSGDLETAEQAILRAESLDAPDGWIPLLRGHLAFQRGAYDEAIEDLQEAAGLLPDSVAAHSLLAAAYVGAGWWEKYEDLLRHTLDLVPLTPEDFLFKGLAESYLDPVRGLTSLNEAIRRHKTPIPIAYVFRSEVWANQAADTGSVRDAQRALDDADMALEMLPRNPAALLTSLFAHMVAAGVYDEARQPEDRQAATLAAEREANRLAPFSHLPSVAYHLSLYALTTGHPERCEQILAPAAVSSESALVTYAYTLALYRRGQSTQALTLLDQNPQRSGNEDSLRALCLLEQPDAEERFDETYQMLQQKYRDGITALFRPALLLLAGRRDEALADSRRLRGAEPHLPRLRRRFYERLLDFNCGQLTEDELLRDAGRSKWDQCEAHFFAGLHRLAAGDRDAARTHFRDAVAMRCWGFMAWDWSLAFLTRMDLDPVWPAWIAATPPARPSE